MSVKALKAPEVQRGAQWDKERFDGQNSQKPNMCLFVGILFHL